eukprot:gene16136-20434_t
MISHYAGAAVDLSDPRLSPALEKLIIGQPKTFVVSGGLDPLAIQAEGFVKRLIAARNKVLYRRYDTLPLGFDLFAGVVDEARAATVDIAREWLDLLRAVAAEPDLAYAAALEPGQPLPVAQWNPPFCGNIDMRIARDGTWLYNGTPILRHAMAQLFARILRREGEAYFLVTPVEKVGITVEDVPFIAVEMTVTHTPDQTLSFRTHVGDVVT